MNGPSTATSADEDMTSRGTSAWFHWRDAGPKTYSPKRGTSSNSSTPSFPKAWTLGINNLLYHPLKLSLLPSYGSSHCITFWSSLLYHASCLVVPSWVPTGTNFGTGAYHPIPGVTFHHSMSRTRQGLSYSWHFLLTEYINSPISVLYSFLMKANSLSKAWNKVWENYSLSTIYDAPAYFKFNDTDHGRLQQSSHHFSLSILHIPRLPRRCASHVFLLKARIVNWNWCFMGHSLSRYLENFT